MPSMAPDSSYPLPKDSTIIILITSNTRLHDPGIFQWINIFSSEPLWNNTNFTNHLPWQSLSVPTKSLSSTPTPTPTFPTTISSTVSSSSAITICQILPALNQPTAQPVPQSLQPTIPQASASAPPSQQTEQPSAIPKIKRKHRSQGQGVPKHLQDPDRFYCPNYPRQLLGVLGTWKYISWTGVGWLAKGHGSVRNVAKDMLMKFQQKSMFQLNTWKRTLMNARYAIRHFCKDQSRALIKTLTLGLSFRKKYGLRWTSSMKEMIKELWC